MAGVSPSGSEAQLDALQLETGAELTYEPPRLENVGSLRTLLARYRTGARDIPYSGGTIR